jgi:hypothetical protein
MISLPKKVFCAPIYCGPQEMRDAVIRELESLENLKPVPWLVASTVFLNKDGSFSLKVIDERSLKIGMQKVSSFMVNLFYSPSRKVPEEQQRLHYARRRLLISLLAHAWLWRRHKVLDNQGNPVAFEDRRVLAPEDILNFLKDTQVHTGRCRCENVIGFLEKVQEVPLLEDTSKWNVMGVTACLWWDKSHDLRKHDVHKGPWCSCRLENANRLPTLSFAGPTMVTTAAAGLAQVRLPSYHEASCHEACPPPYHPSLPNRESKCTPRELRTL